MTRSAHRWRAARTASSPTAPSPTTATVLPGPASAATAPNQPVPSTSEAASRERDQFGTGHLRGGHQGAVGHRDPGQLGLGALGAHGLAVDAAGLVARPAYLAGVVRGEERTDHKVTDLDGGDLVAGLLHDTHVLVPHGGRVRHLVGTAPGPQVRPADAGSGQADNGVGRGEDLRVGPVDDLYLAWGVHHRTTHHSPPLLRFRRTGGRRRPRHVLRKPSPGPSRKAC